MSTLLVIAGPPGAVNESYTDAAATDYATSPTPLAVNRSLVTRHDTFVAALDQSGGQAVRFRPATAADVASLARYARPNPRVTAVDAPAAAESGDIVTIKATVTNQGAVPGGTEVVMTVQGTDIRQTRYVRVDPGSRSTVLFQARLTGDREAIIAVDGRRTVVRLEHPADAYQHRRTWPSPASRAR
jgi:hypothetical protein